MQTAGPQPEASGQVTSKKPTMNRRKTRSGWLRAKLWLRKQDRSAKQKKEPLKLLALLQIISSKGREKKLPLTLWVWVKSQPKTQKNVLTTTQWRCHQRFRFNHWDLV